MTITHISTATRSLRDRLPRLRETLKADRTIVFLCFSEPMGGVFRMDRGVSHLIERIERTDITTLVKIGFLRELSRSERGVRYHAVGTNPLPKPRRAQKAQTAADRHKAKFLEAEKLFRPTPNAKPERIKVNLGESPLGWLSKRKDTQGRPFLSETEVDAGERLRADFERAQLGPSVTQDWRRFLTAGKAKKTRAQIDNAPDEGAEFARKRVMDALDTLGPGLADAALRTCCFLEGLEAVEQAMDWSARSGKIVLKIALQRLSDHYEQQNAANHAQQKGHLQSQHP